MGNETVHPRRKRKRVVAFGIDPCDRCNPPVAYREFAITMDCGHGRNCGGVAVLSAPLTTDGRFCYNISHGNSARKPKPLGLGGIAQG